MRKQMEDALSTLVELFPKQTIFMSVEFNSYYYDFCNERGGTIKFKASVHGPSIKQFEADTVEALADMILDYYTK